MSDLFTVEPSPETLASRFAAMRAELRASPCYLPPCPLCSIIGHDDVPDSLVQPFAMRSRRTARWAIAHKCPLSPSGVGPWCDTEQEAAAWWRDVRRNAPLGVSEAARRELNLARMTAEWNEIEP